MGRLENLDFVHLLKINDLNYHLFVPNTFRGQGFARKLWQVAHDACRDTGNVGEYTVNSSSFAVEMYRRFGFIETGPPKTRNGVRAVPMKLIETA
jgi:predicted GNAT family N-acyltransferase